MTDMHDTERFPNPDELSRLYNQTLDWVSNHGQREDARQLGYAPDGVPICEDVPGYSAVLSGLKTRLLAPAAAGSLCVGWSVKIWSGEPHYDPEDAAYEYPGDPTVNFTVNHRRSSVDRSTHYAITALEGGYSSYVMPEKRRRLSSSAQHPLGSLSDVLFGMHMGNNRMTYTQLSALQTIVDAWQKWGPIVSPGRSRKRHW